ncbi:ABC transporter ATP-binding protein [Anoxybacillus ayderensis]|uniref:ABC transporter ATP-binding protein n=1 Tax=Anoxybacillus sp. ST70 TaxID=2864180 RepID=UPI000320003D|nr:ABC transporter ATP-binding protein [Anoxybacillus sp. ST70]AXM88732.1 ABC transporter ATP-binding protein [Anoxybacillus ayderensis G10]MBW9219462.1 ABC transporter ATP-binding protein [Anoxybacillus sp. ST70]THD16210.1 ABC transporter ATP-binding protein [Anoxybacillus ayderensis]
MENILELDNVCKVFQGFALQNVSFSLEKGYIMGFIGPNGAGKSTTIRCIMDLVHIDSGNIKLFGVDYYKNLKTLKQRIGFVYDQDIFFEDLSVEKNKKIISLFYDTWDDDIFYRYANEFNIPLTKPVKHLSKGTKMKFALAVALSHHAELIIMDEPTTGLDPIFRRELLDILKDIIKNKDKAIFFSTHITTDLEQVADFITFILDGKILFCKKTEELLEHYVIITGSLNLKEVVQAFQPISLKETLLGFEAFFETSRATKIISKYNLSFKKPSLEEIMYYLVKSNNNK